METIKENLNLSENEKLERLKKAKGGTWYDGWRAYRMMCSSSDRMVSTNYGFKCLSCGNIVGFNLTRLAESPLNKITK